jgi:hypothetical protein
MTQSLLKSKSKLCYDRRSVGQSVLVPSLIWGLIPAFFACKTVPGLLTWCALSDQMRRLSFKIVIGLRQRSHSRIWVLRDSYPYYTVSDSRLYQRGGPGPSINIPKEEGDPVTPPDTRFPIRRLLGLTGLQWRYSTPPIRGLQPQLKVKVKVKVTLRLAVYRYSVRLGAKPLETHDQRFVSTEHLRS